MYKQGILFKGEGSVQLTSLYQLVQTCCFSNKNDIFLFYKTTYLNEEVNCDEPGIRAVFHLGAL
jgi:hypothetical protein